LKLRLAKNHEAGAVSLGDYIHWAAEVTKTDAAQLVEELRRWFCLRRQAGDGPLLGRRYVREFGGTTAAMRARSEGFQRVVGVSPEQLIDLLDEAEASEHLFDVMVLPLAAPWPARGEAGLSV
jgi:hypothetical protein